MSVLGTHEVVVIGGGTAGITVAARLRRKGIDDVVIVDPADTHWYQPLWTLVGGGLVKTQTTRRPMAGVIPRGVKWIQRSVQSVDPLANRVILDDGSHIGYRWLVVAAGIQLDWDHIDGLAETIGENGVSSNYRIDTAEYTWHNVATLTSGTALFTMPSGAIKCGGAPQKIAYLACDYWRKKGVLDEIDVHLVLPSPAMFGIKEFSDTLEQVVSRYGITVHLSSELTAMDGKTRTATIRNNASGEIKSLHFDMAHVVPPQSAPDWLKATPLADVSSPGKYVKVDKHTLQHPDFSNVFSLGDCSSAPASKTGAAIRKQAPVLVKNLLAARSGKKLEGSYSGYSSCPIVTSQHTVMMAEFDYDLHRTPTFPVIDMTKERRDMYIVKRYLLPILYWRFMLKGRA